MSALVPNKQLGYIVDDLVVKCEKSAQGCMWAGPLAARQMHLNVCLTIECERLGKEAESQRLRCRAQERLLVMARNENRELTRKNEVNKREGGSFELQVTRMKQDQLSLETTIELWEKEVSTLLGSLTRATTDLRQSNESRIAEIRVLRNRNGRLQRMLQTPTNGYEQTSITASELYSPTSPLSEHNLEEAASVSSSSGYNEDTDDQAKYHRQNVVAV